MTNQCAGSFRVIKFCQLVSNNITFLNIKCHQRSARELFNKAFNFSLNGYRTYLVRFLILIRFCNSHLDPRYRNRSLVYLPQVETRKDAILFES